MVVVAAAVADPLRKAGVLVAAVVEAAGEWGGRVAVGGDRFRTLVAVVVVAVAVVVGVACRSNRPHKALSLTAVVGAVGQEEGRTAGVPVSAVVAVAHQSDRLGRASLTVAAVPFVVAVPSVVASVELVAFAFAVAVPSGGHSSPLGKRAVVLAAFAVAVVAVAAA